MSFLPTIKAFTLRETRAGFVNRFVYVFSSLALVGGLASYFSSPDGEALTGPLLLVQVILYLCSLFGILIGLSSAQSELEEWSILFSHPMSRPAMVIAKFVALAGLMAAASGLLVLPLLVRGIHWETAAVLWIGSALISAAFTSIGLCVGFLFQDRVRGLMAGIGFWLVLLVGIDFVAWLTVDLPIFRQFPSFWIAQLMINPLDSFRIASLFSFGEIPMSITGDHPLVNWWLGHLNLWFLIIVSGWISVTLFIGSCALRRTEV